MKKYIILACAAIFALSSCGVANKSSKLVEKQPVTVGICPSGMSELTQNCYYKCLGDAGAKCVIFTDYFTDDATAAEYMSKVDALIVPGLTANDASGRGKSDKLLIKAAMEQGKPMLGICLGHQRLNGVFGGSNSSVSKLSPDSKIEHKIKIEDNNIGVNSLVHYIKIDRDSKLYHILGDVDSVLVNTSHKYSLDKIGEGVTVVARADDGIVEAIEGKGFIGVQFHPEYLYGRLNIERFLAIFKNLVDEARTIKYGDK